MVSEGCLDQGSSGRCSGAGAVTSGTMLSWLFGPVFREFPGIKIALSEGGIGWMPYNLERAAQIVDRRGALMARGEEPAGRGVTYDETKSLDLSGFDVYSTFREHVYGCFIDDLHGVASIRDIGIDNVMIETDYPHSDSTWPNSPQVAMQQLGHLPHEDIIKITRGNAERLFNFTPSALGSR